MQKLQSESPNYLKNQGFSAEPLPEWNYEHYNRIKMQTAITIFYFLRLIQYASDQIV